MKILPDTRFHFPEELNKLIESLSQTLNFLISWIFQTMNSVRSVQVSNMVY